LIFSGEFLSAKSLKAEKLKSLFVLHAKRGSNPFFKLKIGKFLGEAD